MFSATSVLARALLAVVVLAGSAHVEASAQEPDSLLFSGATNNKEETYFIRYFIYDNGTVEIRELDYSQSRTGTEPDSTINSMLIPESVLNFVHMMVVDAYAKEAPVPEFGIHVEDERLRLQFDQGLPIWMAVSTALLLLLTGGGAVGLTLTRRERKRLRSEAEARQRALHAREAERSRIAREIHDGPLQDVHALRLHSGGQLPEPVSEEASRIARELRAIAEGLRPPALGRFGLAAALSAHANRVKDRHPGVSMGLALDEDGTGPDALPDVVRSALFRIAQESISNAIEHGHATRVHVRLGLPTGDDPIELEIRDNGSGLPWGGAQPDFAALADDGHFGLVGMYERAVAIGGILTLAHGGLDDTGARIHVALPDVRKKSAPVSRTRRFFRSAHAPTS